MSKYYCLVAGLPNIAFDDSKLKYSICDFREELDGVLTMGDRKLIDLFFLKFDNKNLIEFARHPDQDPDPRGRITYDEFNDLYQALKNEDKLPKNKNIPPYFEVFLRNYIESQKENHPEKDNDDSKSEPLLWEDRLAALYYSYAMKCSNKFVSSWFELNLNINNFLTALTCRQYDLDRKQYIVGDNEVAKTLRTSNARDFGLDYDSLEYLQEVQRIAEEPDLLLREKKLDLLRWNWLETQTFYKTFDIESIFAYMLKLEMIERWMSLSKTVGEETFREIVGTMKKGAENALEEFKRNNEK